MAEVRSIFVPLSDRHLRAIGLVTHQWTVAQLILEHLIWALVPVGQKTGQILTTHLTDDLRLNMVRALLKKLEPGAQVEEVINGLLVRYDELRQDRNRVVHNSWAGEATPLVAGLKTTARGELRVARALWGADDIEGLASDIEEWTVEAVNLVNGQIGWPADDA